MITDISTNFGIEVLAKKEVMLREILNKEKIKLEFIIDILSILEFRVLSLGISMILIGIKPSIMASIRLKK
ncbi:hypothetical protein NIES4072_52130 [Nostoc commune NIES-4072]|uniref:Uncharacterized protein n=1 Tax=Nostoc commune NIES-4072 TaxID=2005467 RepID=A0A2R5FRY7_NOSCO|nr:hypothetical protein [Nostoc commune]BBD67491.1 hypothetical protein NIES4070_38820 [Nostoc commune HK-02]GBG21527.1 hypothetical protein NIES4072_52130 [Nostoc commune NIES-4072]